MGRYPCVWRPRAAVGPSDRGSERRFAGCRPSAATLPGAGPLHPDFRVCFVLSSSSQLPALALPAPAMPRGKRGERAEDLLRLATSDPLFHQLRLLYEWMLPPARYSRFRTNAQNALESFQGGWCDLLPPEREDVVGRLVSRFCLMEAGIDVGWEMVRLRFLLVASRDSRPDCRACSSATRGSAGRSSGLHPRSVASCTQRPASLCKLTLSQSTQPTNVRPAAAELNEIEALVERVVQAVPHAHVATLSTWREGYFGDEGVTRGKLHRMTPMECAAFKDELAKVADRAQTLVDDGHSLAHALVRSPWSQTILIGGLRPWRIGQADLPPPAALGRLAFLDRLHHPAAAPRVLPHLLTLSRRSLQPLPLGPSSGRVAGRPPRVPRPRARNAPVGRRGRLVLAA